MEKEKRIYLRDFTTDKQDMEDYFDIVSNEEVALASGSKPIESYIESCKKLRRLIDMDICKAIVLKSTDRVIGIISFQKDIHRFNKYSLLLGYELNTKYWGNGYMQEAVELALDHAFLKLNAKIVSVSHFIQNTRSQKVVEKVGFVYEGTIRQEFLRFDDYVFDSKIYSMTKQEYDQRQNNLQG